MDREQFIEIYTKIKTAFPESKVMETDEEMDFWFTNLQYNDFEDVSEAVNKWRLTHKWAPSIAELIEASDKAKSDRELKIIEDIYLRRRT